MNDESVDELTDIDWRFAEFTSAPAHVLYSTCTELLALPVPGEQLGEELINVIFKWLVPPFSHLLENRGYRIFKTTLIVIHLQPNAYLWGQKRRAS